jgi:hypothetical protein
LLLKYVGLNGDYTAVFVYSCGIESGRPPENTRKEGGTERGPASDPQREIRDTRRFRELGLKFILEQLSNTCRKFLQSKGFPIEELVRILGGTRFWDGHFYASKELSLLPGVVGPFSQRTLGELLHPWAAAVVVANQARTAFPHVVFNRRLFGSGLDVLHEVLHIATQEGDWDLAKLWHLGTFNDDSPGRAQASQAITKFFDPKGWDCGAGIGWPAP